jgi:diamine N-acetyltransferase
MKNSNPEVSLREVTKETLRDITRLRVRPEQGRFVATNAESIAEAYFSPDVAWFRAIYADDTPVGFVMLADNAAEERYYLWRFMIDARHQGRGIGQKALELLFEYVKTRPGAKVLYTSCVPGAGSPGPFYEKMGFVYTGEEDDGELVMRRELAATAVELDQRAEAARARHRLL